MEEAKVVFDEIQILIEIENRRKEEEYMEQMKCYQEMLYDRELRRAEKEEQRNRIAHWKAQTKLHPLPKCKYFHKPTWLRTRSNPKLR